MSGRPKVDVVTKCPLCGGESLHRWRRVCLYNFWLFFVTFIITVTCFPSLMIPCVNVLYVISFCLAILSFFGLPIIGSIAIVSRYQCQDCRCRFWPISGQESQVDVTRFPVWFGWVNFVVLLASFGIGARWLQISPGQGVFDVSMMLFGRMVLGSLFVSLVILIQAILWHCLRKAKQLKFSLVLIVPILLFSMAWLSLTRYDHNRLVREYDPLILVPDFLDSLKFAPLPPSARHVNLEMNTFICSANAFVCFEADSNDIQCFVTDSLTLAHFSLSPINTTWQDARTTIANHANSDFAPSWYNQPLSKQVRFYRKSNRWGGYTELYIDDVHDAIYIYWCK